VERYWLLIVTVIAEVAETGSTVRSETTVDAASAPTVFLVECRIR
jgi:hypothetical protein